MKTQWYIIFLVLGFTAVADEGDFKRTHAGTWEQDIGYTQIVQDGKTLYLSGVVAGGETMEEQVRGAYTRIVEMLLEYDVGTDRIVKEVLYTTDMEAMKTAIPIRKEFFPHEKYPAATWVQIERLFSEGAMVEVDVTAVLP